VEEQLLSLSLRKNNVWLNACNVMLIYSPCLQASTVLFTSKEKKTCRVKLEPSQNVYLYYYTVGRERLSMLNSDDIMHMPNLISTYFWGSLWSILILLFAGDRPECETWKGEGSQCFPFSLSVPTWVINPIAPNVKSTDSIPSPLSLLHAPQKHLHRSLTTNPIAQL
jgi:hypothetical protein